MYPGDFASFHPRMLPELLSMKSAWQQMWLNWRSQNNFYVLTLLSFPIRSFNPWIGGLPTEESQKSLRKKKVRNPKERKQKEKRENSLQEGRKMQGPVGKCDMPSLFQQHCASIFFCPHDFHPYFPPNSVVKKIVKIFLFWVHKRVSASISHVWREECEKESVGLVVLVVGIDSPAEAFECNCFFLRGGVPPWSASV